MARDKIISDVLSFLKSLISSKITDPVSASRGNSSKFVMSTFPQREVKYPLVTIETINVEEFRSGMQTSAMDITLTVQLRIWSKSVTQSDKLSQQILDLLADEQFTTNGSIDNNFHSFNILSATRVDEAGERGIKSRIIQLQYRFFNV